MKNSTYSRRSQTVSTVKKSQATIPAACWRRKARHDVAVRRGAGSIRWRCSVVRIAVAETRVPSRSSSPWMRWSPQRGFSLARRTISAWSARIRPRAGDQATVPAQQRLRLDKQAGPARSGQHAADCSQQGTVGGLEPWAWGLAAQDAELVAQHQEFQVLGGVAACQECEQLDGAAQREVGEP
jgi:hypothetical protein